MDKINAMTTFVAIVKHGSLTAAGAELDKSLPTVVRVLAALEKYLGVQLLNRTTRRLALTEEGRHYFDRCQRILADIEQTELELGDEHGEPPRTIAGYVFRDVRANAHLPGGSTIFGSLSENAN